MNFRGQDTTLRAGHIQIFLPDFAIFKSKSDAIVFRYPLIAVEVNLRIDSVEPNMNSGYL